MDSYIYLVQEPSGANILVSCDYYAKEGYLAEYADGNIGRIQESAFFTHEQVKLLKESVDIYPAENVYIPSPDFKKPEERRNEKT